MIFVSTEMVFDSLLPQRKLHEVSMSQKSKAKFLPKSAQTALIVQIRERNSF